MPLRMPLRIMKRLPLKIMRRQPLKILRETWKEICALYLLFFLVVYRTRVTIYPELDVILCKPQEDFHGYVCNEVTTSSEFACVGIWITVTYITCSLSLRIIITGLGRSAFNSFHKILSLLSIMSYEIWMFAYIYNTYYVREFDPIFKVIIFFPLLTLLVHSIFQTFLPYNKRVVDLNDEESMKDLKYYIYTSIFFNFIMIIHVFCMAITAWCTGLPQEDNPMYVIHVIILGVAEVANRIYVIYKYKRLLEIHRSPSSEAHKEAISETRGANKNSLVVTGKTCKREQLLSIEYVVPVVATFGVAFLGAFVSGKIAKS